LALIVLLLLRLPNPSELLMNSSTPKIVGLCAVLLCCFVLISLPSNHAFANQIPAKRLATGLDEKAPRQDEVMQAGMKKYLGVPYKRAGASKKGFDCSGFVKVIYDEIFGVNLPHQSSQQSLSPELVGISLDSLRMGDLVFFSISGRNKAINHVGIYLSDGKFIHAGRSSGVVVSELNAPYWRSKVVGARRLADRNPVNPERNFLDLALFFDRENAVSFRYERGSASPYQTPLFEINPLHPFKEEELHRVELELTSGIHPSLISRFTAFRESLFFGDDGDRLAHQPILGSPDGYENRSAFAQGLRVSGNLRPAANLSVTPSLSYFEYGPSVNEAALPKLVAGLQFDLSSASSGWSFSTDFRMPLSRYPQALLSGQADESFVDVVLTYRQRLSSSVHFSLSGEKHFGFIPALRDSQSRRDTEDQKLTLMLHFFY
jgi:probable lipoprotein NlpC